MSDLSQKCSDSSKTENESSDDFEKGSWKIWKKRRYVVALTAFLGFFCVYCLRVKMSMAIVAMTENRTVTLENGTQIIEQDFNWSNTIQSIILSSFFYGYVVTQIAGGYLASRIGGRTMLGLAVAVPSILTISIPWFAKIHVNCLIVIRVLEGIFEGVSYPCMYAMYAKWAPPLERARLANIAFSGSYIGTVFTMPACAYLTELFGWESIFYFLYVSIGTQGLIWFIFWITFIADSPEKDKRISPSELKYITASLSETTPDKPGPVPWRGLLTSLPVWATIIASFADAWGFYTLLTYLPKYLKDTLNFDLNSSGFIASLPYLSMFIVAQFAGVFADWFLVKELLTTTQVRKLFTCIGLASQSLFLLGAAYWSSRFGTVFCITMASALGTLSSAGYSTSYLELVPRFAGLLMGISNTFGSSAGIYTPIVTGAIVKSPPTLLQWHTVFYISAAVCAVGAVFYGFFGSAEIQPWAIVHKTQEPGLLEAKKDTERKKSTISIVRIP